MRTRFNARAVIAPLAFAFFAVVLSMLAWLNFDGSLPLQAREYRVSFVVPQAGNLQVGASVRSAGVEIGRVVEVERANPRAAKVTAELEGSVVPLRADARVAVRAKSLLGEPYLQVNLGTRGAPAVPEGGELPITAAVATQQLDDVLSTFDPATRAGARRLVKGFSQAVDGRGADISNALGQARPAATGSADLAEIVDKQRGSLRRLIRSGGAVLSEAGGREGAIQGLVTEGDRLFDVTGRRTDQITRIVRALPGFLGEVRGAGDAITAATPDLRSAVRALGPVATRLDPALRALQEMLPQARGLFADLPATLAAGRRGLPPGQRLLENLRPALDGLYPALREILPSVQFAAEDPSFVTSTAANLARHRQPVRARSGRHQAAVCASGADDLERDLRRVPGAAAHEPAEPVPEARNTRRRSARSRSRRGRAITSTIRRRSRSSRRGRARRPASRRGRTSTAARRRTTRASSARPRSKNRLALQHRDVVTSRSEGFQIRSEEAHVPCRRSRLSRPHRRHRRSTPTCRRGSADPDPSKGVADHLAGTGLVPSLIPGALRSTMGVVHAAEYWARPDSFIKRCIDAPKRFTLDLPGAGHDDRPA